MHRESRGLFVSVKSVYIHFKRIRSSQTIHTLVIIDRSRERSDDRKICCFVEKEKEKSSSSDIFINFVISKTLNFCFLFSPLSLARVCLSEAFFSRNRRTQKSNFRIISEKCFFFVRFKKDKKNEIIKVEDEMLYQFSCAGDRPKNATPCQGASCSFCANHSKAPFELFKLGSNENNFWRILFSKKRKVTHFLDSPRGYFCIKSFIFLHCIQFEQKKSNKNL